MGLVLTALGGRVCVLEAGHAVEDRDDPRQRQSLDKRRAERMHENALATGSQASCRTHRESGEPHQAHPAYWVPFVVAGEGAAR